MEFRITTFNQSDEQPSTWQPGLTYSLILVILILIMYILFQMGVSGWILTLSVLAVFSMTFFLKFHDMGKKEIIEGNFGRELELTPEFLRIDNITLRMDEIDAIEIVIDKYEGQMIPYFSTYGRSKGVSNKLSVSSNGRTYTEFFRLGNERHYHDLLLVTQQLTKGTIKLNLIDKS